MAGQNVIDQLRLLERDHGGFPVSRLEHSLQTATRAEEDGRDEEYVLCALIHDIGDTLAPYNHPSIAAGLSSRSCRRPTTGWSSITASSRATTSGTSSAPTATPATRYRDSPYYEYTEEFCAKYDQTAFDPDYVSAPLAHYEPLIRQYLVRTENWCLAPRSGA